LVLTLHKARMFVEGLTPHRQVIKMYYIQKESYFQIPKGKIMKKIIPWLLYIGIASTLQAQAQTAPDARSS